MILGRFIFGLGGESLAVSQLPMVSKWFGPTQLSLAWGFGRAAIRVGSSLNSFFTPRIYVWTNNIYAPFFVGTILTIVSWISGLVLSYMDWLADKQEGELQTVVPPKDRFHWKDLKTLPFIFYLLLVNYPCLYGSFFGLSFNITNVMVQRFGFSVTTVGNLVMIIYLLAACLRPLVGPLLDKYGRRIRVIFCAAILFLLMGIFFLFLEDRTRENPHYGVIVPLSGVSIFYAIYSVAFWPCLPLIVEKKILGTATGIVTAVFNLMLTLLPIVLGVIHDNTLGVHKGYFWTIIALCILITLGALMTIWIFYEDKKKGGKLDKSPEEKEFEIKPKPLIIDEEEEKLKITEEDR